MTNSDKTTKPVIDAELLSILACPSCRSPVAWREPSTADRGKDDKLDGWLACQGGSCGLRYPVREGIPEMLIDEASPPESAGRGTAE